MTVLEIMERANSRDTNLVIAWIKDAVHAIESTQVEKIKTDTQTITKKYRLKDDDNPSIPSTRLIELTITINTNNENVIDS